MTIEAEHICKAYGDHPVLCDFNLSIQTDACIVVTGPSGSGKTTFMRILLGLEKPVHRTHWKSSLISHCSPHHLIALCPDLRCTFPIDHHPHVIRRSQIYDGERCQMETVIQAFQHRIPSLGDAVHDNTPAVHYHRPDNVYTSHASNGFDLSPNIVTNGIVYWRPSEPSGLLSDPLFPCIHHYCTPLFSNDDLYYRNFHLRLWFNKYPEKDQRRNDNKI